jgi:hypothetical protein
MRTFKCGGVLLLAAFVAACGSTPPVASTPIIPNIAGNYLVKITAAPGSCPPSAPQQVGFNWPSGAGIPLIQTGADVTMTLQGAFATLNLSGTVSFDNLSFSVSTKQSNPLESTSGSGAGSAALLGNTISGTFAGDFVYVAVAFTPTPLTCHATNHLFTLTRVP